MIKYFLLIGLFIFIMISCKDDKTPTPNKEVITDTLFTPNGITQPSISKGLYGYTILKEGDFMPVVIDSQGNSIGGPRNSKTDTLLHPVAIYHSEVIMSINTEPGMDYIFQGEFPKTKIAKNPEYIVYPNESGFYQVSLPTGEYQLFSLIHEDTLSRGFTMCDDNGTIQFDKKINEGQLQNIDILIDHKTSH